MRNLSHSILFILIAILASAQLPSQTIKGIVLEASSKEPLIGANVLLKGTKIGTLTDIDGSFSIDVPDTSRSELVISFIGYVTKEVKVKGSTLLEIELSESLNFLEEVVVTGLSRKARKQMTGAVSTLQCRASSVSIRGYLSLIHI